MTETNKSPRLKWLLELRDRGLIRRLKSVQFKVLWVLSMYANSETLKAVPSVTRLAANLGHADDLSKVHRTLVELEGLGFIESVVVQMDWGKCAGWHLTLPPEGGNDEGR
jgi:hypothetical protein